MGWNCEICGKDTSNVDYDYLIGNNHLGCVLGVWGGNDIIDVTKKRKKYMKIKNWDKIFGITYRGYSLVNPVHNADETIYYADVLNLNLVHKPKLDLVLDTNRNEVKDYPILIKITDGGYTTQKYLKKVEISSLSSFTRIYENLIEQIVEYKTMANLPF